jgi:hypothetical protein
MRVLTHTSDATVMRNASRAFVHDQGCYAVKNKMVLDENGLSEGV